MEICQIIDEFLGLRRRQLVLIFLRIRAHIAMHAFEIAGLRGIPDNDRPHPFRCSIAHRMGILRIPQAIAKIIAGK